MEANAYEYTTRFGTALISDAAYRVGATVRVGPSVLRPIDSGRSIAGPVCTVEANNDLVSILAAQHGCAAGDVLVVSNRTKEVALMGDLIGTEAVRRKLGGFIVDACVRDAASLRAMGLSVFCRGRVPVGPLKLPTGDKGIGETGTQVSIGDVTVSPGDWAFGDEDGIVFLDAGDLPAVEEQAVASLRREKALLEEIESGRPLGDVLDLDRFLRERRSEPGADFNKHLARIGRAI